MSAANRRVALVLAGAAVAGWSAWVERPSAPQAPGVGPWPDLPVRDLADRPLTLPAHAARVRIINVWARWCEPCRRELPSLQRLAQGLDPAQVDLLALALDDDAFALREYLAGQRLSLQVLRHEAHARGVPGADRLPQTFVVAPDARVLARWTGARAWDQPEHRAQVLAAVQGAASPSRAGST